MNTGFAFGRLAAVTLVVSFNAHASDIFDLSLFGFETKVIYGTDDRQDLYQVNNPVFRTLADSTAALFQNSKIIAAADPTQPTRLRTSQYGSAMGLCKTEPFYDQPMGAFCSGSLVGPDLLMTAGHCITSQANCADTSFVFGYALNEATAFPNEVPSGDVYKCKTLVKQFVSGKGADYALVQLDRVVTNHVPVKINRLKDIEPGTGLVVIGHPSGLPTKVSAGANVRSLEKGFFQANLDTYGGNSGSAVFNTTTGLVEGILVRGENDFTYANGCRVSNQCTDTGCRGEDVTNIDALAQFIPEI